jgi:hypothetical protein
MNEPYRRLHYDFGLKPTAGDLDSL